MEKAKKLNPSRPEMAGVTTGTMNAKVKRALEDFHQRSFQRRTFIRVRKQSNCCNVPLDPHTQHWRGYFSSRVFDFRNRKELLLRLRPSVARNWADENLLSCCRRYIVSGLTKSPSRQRLLYLKTNDRLNRLFPSVSHRSSGDSILW